MKKLILSFAIIVTGLIAVTGQNLPGFNYQAVVRDASGEIVTDQNIRMRISLLKGSVNGEQVLQEVFTPTTNEFGLVNIVVGSVNSDDFGNIDWSGDNFYIKVEVDIAGGTSYTTMGTSQLLSVPYAQYAFSAGEWKNVGKTIYTHKNVGIGTATPTGRMQVVEDGDATVDKPIFEVVNNNGETVFAVYHNRVEINFEDNDYKTRGGFAVSGRTSTKEDYREFFTINADETRVYVDNLDDKTRGGFAVSGRTSTKEDPLDIFLVQPGLTQVFVDEPAGIRKTRGGFAVSGRTSTKYEYEDIFTVQPGLTQIFIDETTNKTRGGFAVSGRTSTKDDGIYDVLAVKPERTEIFINPSPEKFFDDGFSISLYDDLFNYTELFAVAEGGAVVNVGMAIAPRVSTSDVNEELITETSANAGGRVYEYGGTPIDYRGVVYSVDPRPHQTVEIDLENPPTNPEHSGWVLDIVAGFGLFEVNLLGLAPGTTYYVSAFAINQDSLVGFGPVKSFTTVALPGSAVFNVTNEAAVSLVNISIEMYNDPDYQNFYAGQITDEFGVATFGEIPAGTWYFKAIDDYYYEYQTVEGSIVVQQSEITNEDIVMIEHPKHDVTFEVDHGGSPVEGAMVYLVFQAENKNGGSKPTAPLEEVTGVDGIAIFEGVPEGYYSYEVDHSLGFYNSDGSILIDRNMTIPVTIAGE